MNALSGNSILFSIIIPTYNRAELLKRCLDSVESQSYNNWEAIVVDNYSEDNTEEVVLSYNDNRIKYIKNHNYGVIAVSRNKALDVAKGDWVAFLDSDDCWLPNKLEYVLPFLDKYDLVYHGYQQNIPKKNFWHKRERYFYDIKEPTVSYVIQRGDPINPSCTCVRRSIVGDTRFIEDKKYITVEDYDFFLELLSKNIRVKYLRIALTLYDVGGCSHGLIGSDNELELYKRWKSRIGESTYREAYLQYLLRRSGYFMSEGLFDDSKKMYKELLSSSILTKRIMGLVGYAKCLLKIKKIL